LESFARQVGLNRVRIWKGPQQGFAANFLSLLARPEIKGHFFAFADQDDIWLPHKLSRSLSWLALQKADQAALYCSRTILIDEQNSALGKSMLFSRTPSFANALVQSIAGGNTMVFNIATRRLLLSFRASVVVSHDWWVYIVVSGCGGIVHYDSQAHTLYRQHQENIIGMNSNFKSRLNRIRQLFQGRFRDWNDRHLHILEQHLEQLTPANAVITQEFLLWRNQDLFKRIRGFWSSPLYRQTVLGNLGLWVGVLFKKV
jgi:hypothetical protein